MTAENIVEVNPEGLAAEAGAVEIPTEPGAPPAPAGAQQVAPSEMTMEQLQAHVPAWKPGTDLIANTFADLIAPNWRLTALERDQVSGSLALALSTWFPDDVIPVKYLVLLNVGASFWNLAASRRDPQTGKILPMRLAPPPDSAKTADAPAPASGETVTTSANSAAATST